MSYEDRFREALRRADASLPAGPEVTWDETIAKARRDTKAHIAFMGAAAAIIVALAVVSFNALQGSRETGPIPPAPAPTSTPSQPTEPTPSPSPSAEPTCSASGMSAQLSEQDLPEAVASTRAQIAEAAVACDYDELARLARAGDDPFTYTHGEGTNPVRYWRTLENDPSVDMKPMATLVRTLDLSHCIEEATSASVTLYAWPAVQCSTSTNEDYDELIGAGLYTREDVRSFKQLGMFLGWRVGITAEGEWLYFTAGD